MTKVLIIGATSAIAQATARRFAQKGAQLYLLARNPERLAALSSDLKIRGAETVKHAILDANNFAGHATAVALAMDSLGSVDVVLIAYSTLGNQLDREKGAVLTVQELNTNAISVISLLTYLANALEAQGRGTIAVISSV